MVRRNWRYFRCGAKVSEFRGNYCRSTATGAFEWLADYGVVVFVVFVVTCGVHQVIAG